MDTLNVELTPPDMTARRLIATSEEENKSLLRELAYEAQKKHMTYGRFVIDKLRGYIWLEAWKIQPTTPTPFNGYQIAGNA